MTTTPIIIPPTGPELIQAAEPQLAGEPHSQPAVNGAFPMRRISLFAIPILTAGILFLDFLTPLGVVDWVLYFIPMLLSFYAGNRLSPLFLAAIYSILTVMGYYGSPPGLHGHTAAINLLLGLGTLWVVAILLAQLRKSSSETRKLTAAVEQNPASIVITDCLGRIEFVNPKFCALTGYNFKEVCGKNPNMLKSGETPSKVYRQLWQTITAGQEWRGQFRNRKKNGELYLESTSISPIRDESGNISHFVAVKEDITERKRAEEALSASEERLRLALAAGKLGTFEHRSGDNLVLVSPEFCRILGLPVQTSISHDEWLGRMHPQDRNRVLAGVRQFQTQQVAFDIEYRICLPDGGVRWIHAMASPVADTGNCAGAHGVVQDITERKQAEEATREIERMLARAMSLAHLVAWEYDVASGLFSFSDRYYALHGTTAELEGGNLMSAEAFAQRFLHPDDAHLVADEVAKAVTTADPEYVSQLDTRIFRRDGELRHVLVHISITKDAEGRTTQLLGANQDITERKKSEQELRNLWRAVEQSPATVVITNISGKIEYVNPKFVETTGYSVAEALGQNPRVLKSGLHEASFYKTMWITLLQGNVWQGEIHNKKKNGDLYWESASISPVRDSAGEIIHFIAVKEDITERKRREEALREKDRLLSESQRLGHIGSWFYEMTGPISWSEEMYRIYGVSPDTFIPTVESFIGLMHPDDRSGMQAWLAGCAAGEKSVEFEFRIIRPDGKIRFIKGNGEAVHVENKLIHMAGTAQDITERKNAALKLAELEERETCSRRALEHERELNQIKSRFVSLVSHEFRTPLCVIRMAGSMLGRYLDRMTANEKSRQLEGIQSAVDRMTRMMEDLLIHGEFEAGKMECKPARVDLQALCHRSVSEAISQAGMPRAIECVVDPAVREAVGDAMIIRHILSNLLSNAVKYSPADQPVTLEVKRVAGNGQKDGDAKMPEGDRLQFKVSDSGIGIPAPDLARLFQTFQRASNVGNRPGTGMGLAIVKQFVDLHRGTIRAESVEGKGTTFWVWLPMVSPALAKGD
jgi:PAS domain S-box-containing protein